MDILQNGMSVNLTTGMTAITALASTYLVATGVTVSMALLDDFVTQVLS